MKCPYQTITINQPESFGIDAREVKTFGNCVEKECPFYYTINSIEHCRRAESEVVRKNEQ